MLNLLVFIGFCLIAFGIYIDKKKNIKSDEVQGLRQLRLRIEHLENSLYNYNNILEEEPITFKDVLDSVSNQQSEGKIEISSKTSDDFEIISQYEDGKYTLEEVCKILNMKKGEVLLLKNLYKKYQE